MVGEAQSHDIRDTHDRWVGLPTSIYITNSHTQSRHVGDVSQCWPLVGAYYNIPDMYILRYRYYNLLSIISCWLFQCIIYWNRLECCGSISQ